MVMGEALAYHTERSLKGSMRENGFRAKFERYVAGDRQDADLRRKAITAITAKMARVVHALIKAGADYRPFVEGPVPGGGTPLCRSRRGASATP